MSQPLMDERERFYAARTPSLSLSLTHTHTHTQTLTHAGSHLCTYSLFLVILSLVKNIVPGCLQHISLVVQIVLGCIAYFMWLTTSCSVMHNAEKHYALTWPQMVSVILTGMEVVLRPLTWCIFVNNLGFSQWDAIMNINTGFKLGHRGYPRQLSTDSRPNLRIPCGHIA